MQMTKRLNLDRQILLLDFDGTVVVTEVLARRAIESYFRDRRLTVPDAFPKMIIGRTWKAAVEEMEQEARALGIRVPGPVELQKEFQDRYHALFSEGVPLVPGFQERLPELRARAEFVGIVTGSEHQEVEQILEQWGLRGSFDRIWAAGDYPSSKPDPAPYLKAVEQLGADPARVLVFEDSLAGMESAHRAGLPFVQVSHESHSPADDPRAVLTIRNWFELPLQSKE